MIPRYARPEMTAIWTPESRYSIWLEIETLAMEAMGDLGVIPKSAAKTYREKGKFDVERIDEIEREVKHDVIAFLTSVSEHVGDEARFAHQGMTSSDVLDTCLAVQMARAADLLIAGNQKVMAALKKRALEHKLTPKIGRSHGIHAEPTTFGLTLAGHYAEFARNDERLKVAKKEIATCAISGAVGTFAQIDPRVEAYVADKLGLAVEPVSNSSHSARPACGLFRSAWNCRLQCRALGDGNPPSAAHRSSRSRGVFHRRSKRLFGHAA